MQYVINTAYWQDNNVIIPIKITTIMFYKNWYYNCKMSEQTPLAIWNPYIHSNLHIVINWGF